MLRSLPLWVSLFTLASAANDGAFEYAGFFQGGSVDSPAAQATYEEGYVQGGLVSSIVPFEQSLALDGPNSTWTFQVITNVWLIPDKTNLFGQPNLTHDNNLQQINTQWHLNFSSADNQSLNELIYEPQYKIRLDLVHVPSPAVLTKNFTGNSGDCTPIIGASCLEAMRYEAQSTTNFRWNQSRLASSGCSDTLAQQLVDNQLNLDVLPLNQSQINTTHNANIVSSGAPLIYWDSEIYQGSLSAAYENALHLHETALNILIVTPRQLDSNIGARLPPQSAVCAVIQPRLISAAIPLRAMSTFLAMVVSVGATMAIMW